ncbi:MAG: ferrochelatase [Nitrospirota bacterium]|nr:ferrochelatase [Nitrospirota bacterium]
MTSDDKQTGVLLLNLGGPDSLEAVRSFLFNLFSDREIIRLGPSFMQKPLAWIISSLRAGKTAEAYKRIGGKSPILDITSAQAKALEMALNTARPGNIPGEGALAGRTRREIFRVYVGMRYWHPLIDDVVPKICNDGIGRLVALSLYPQYSDATAGSSFSRLRDISSHYPLEVVNIMSWFNHPLYINAVVDVIKKGFKLFNDDPRGGGPERNIHLLFSAHGLPVKFIEEGDPYVDQLMGTIREVTGRIDVGWDLSYQSRSGPVKWLEPSTDEMIRSLAQKGIKNILVVPISFVSDHIETLYEIDMLYKNMAEALGMRLERVESLNTSPLFIDALRDIVLIGMKDAHI